MNNTLRNISIDFVKKTVLIRKFHILTKGWAWFIGMSVCIYGLYDILANGGTHEIFYILMIYFVGRIIFNDIYDYLLKKAEETNEIK